MNGLMSVELAEALKEHFAGDTTITLTPTVIRALTYLRASVDDPEFLTEGGPGMVGEIAALVVRGGDFNSNGKDDPEEAQVVEITGKARATIIDCLEVFSHVDEWTEEVSHKVGASFARSFLGMLAMHGLEEICADGYCSLICFCKGGFVFGFNYLGYDRETGKPGEWSLNS